MICRGIALDFHEMFPIGGSDRSHYVPCRHILMLKTHLYPSESIRSAVPRGLDTLNEHGKTQSGLMLAQETIISGLWETECNANLSAHVIADSCGPPHLCPDRRGAGDGVGRDRRLLRARQQDSGAFMDRNDWQGALVRMVRFKQLSELSITPSAPGVN